MKFFVSAVFLLSVGIALGDDCQNCRNVRVASTGSFGQEFPRYLGVWHYAGNYQTLPFYMCTDDCMGLRNYLMFINDYESTTNGVWAIVDCQPDDVACAGTHKYLKSGSAPFGDKCPWNANGPWEFCSGDMLVGGGCTEYTVDNTVELTCAD